MPIVHQRLVEMKLHDTDLRAAGEAEFAIHATDWQRTLAEGVIAGSVASLTSSVALALGGVSDAAPAVAPINGPSQWVWGKHAPYQNRGSLKYTLVGYLI